MSLPPWLRAAGYVVFVMATFCQFFLFTIFSTCVASNFGFRWAALGADLTVLVAALAALLVARLGWVLHRRKNDGSNSAYLLLQTCLFTIPIFVAILATFSARMTIAGVIVLLFLSAWHLYRPRTAIRRLEKPHPHSRFSRLPPPNRG